MNNPVPRLDLAPRLKRRLQPWNPLDYLRLLYWVFYFPQALRWYEETFGDPRFRGQIGLWRTELLHDPVRRDLVLIGCFLTLLIPPLLSLALQSLGLPASWFAVTSMITGIVAMFLAGQAANTVASVVAGIVAIGVASVVVSVVAVSVTYGIAAGTVSSIAVGLAVSIVVGTASGVAIGVSTITPGSVTVSTVVGIAGGIAVGVAISVVCGITVGIIGGLAVSITMLRLLDYLLSAFLASLSINSSSLPFLLRITPIPLPGISSRLEHWLLVDWRTGVYNINQVFTYSRQFIPIVQAIKRAINRLPEEQIVVSVVELTNDLHHCGIIRFVTTSLIHTILKAIINAFFLLPSQLRRHLTDHFDLTPRLDTSARAACAGFWYLCQQMAREAKDAFAVVRHLPGGEACYRLASALVLAQRCRSLADLAALGTDDSFLSMTRPPIGDPLGQRETWPVLAGLRRAAQEASAVHGSVSRVVRSQALNRALAEVNAILEQVDRVPRPEQALVRTIALAWRDILLATTAEVGQAMPAQPVRNPYIIGDPVIGKGLVGRDDVLRQLEELWYDSASPPSVVIFGHRRMGKTSILRNLNGRFGNRVWVAYTNLLTAGDLRGGTVDLLLRLADSIADTCRARGLATPAIDEAAFERHPERAFERFLSQIGDRLGEQRLIIALDEFEQLEEWITGGRLPPDILKVLRGYVQMDARIAFAFAGLHTLEEMSGDYFQPFFASVVPVKVSFLSRDATAQVLANPPDPDFGLDYEREALDYIWELTSGQPYLVQLIGHRLVSRFNTLTFEQGRAQEPRFDRADVEAVIGEDFYERARYYFSGVWGQAQQGAPAQHDVLRCLAAYPAGLTLEQLCAASGLPEHTVDQALQTLRRHDVVHEHDGRWRYTVELFRRWVEIGNRR